MTDRQGALRVLVSLDAPEREAALGAFYERFRDDALVLDGLYRFCQDQLAPVARPTAERRSE